MRITLPTPRRFRFLLLMTLLLLVVTAFGTRSLRDHPYWYDEWFSLHVVGGDAVTPRTLPQILAQNEAPLDLPSYYVALAGWGALVGWSEMAVRSLSLLAGVLAVAVVYRLGCEIESRWVGFYAALALASSAFYAMYLHEARTYALLTLFSALSLWLYWRAYRVRATWGVLIGLYAALVALLYAHYAAVVVPVALGLYHLLSTPRDQRWLRVLVVLGAAGATYALWLGITVGALATVSSDLSRQFVSPDIVTGASNLLYLFSNGSIALLALFAVSSLQGARGRDAGGRMAWMVGVVALALALVLNERFHYLTNSRYLMALLPLLAVIVGVGAARVKWAAPGMAIWVAAGLVVIFNPALLAGAWIIYLPWDKVAQERAAHTLPADPIVYLLPDGTPDWVHDPVAHYYLPGADVDVIDSLPDKLPEDYDADLAAAVGDAPLFWIAFDPQHRHSIHAERALQRLVNGRYAACEPAVHEPEVTLQLYAATAPEDAPFDLRFGDGGGIALREMQPLGADGADGAGGRLRVLLQASVDPSVAMSDYSVALHVENADGQEQLVAQTDFGLASAAGCYDAEIGGLPPGTYRALLVVYGWQTGERLAGENVATGETGDRLPLGTFTVTG